MSDTTISDIQAKHSEAAGKILNDLYRSYDAIAEEKLDERAAHYSRLTDAQRAAALRDHRLDLANEAREEAKTKYTNAVHEYREQLEARKAEAEAELYGHGDDASADLLARAALATDQELKNLAQLASKTGNTALRRAALVAGEQRGLASTLVETLDDQAREIYAEIADAPPSEVLDRVTGDAGIDAVVPSASVNQISPPATVNPY